MEKKQLNFNVPLLSVRRNACISGASNEPNKKKDKRSQPLRQRSVPTDQLNKELDEVTKPGAVPFIWEQMPGRTKSEWSGEIETPKRSLSTPRLPPGRLRDGSRRNSGERPIDYDTQRSNFEVLTLSDHAALVESLRASIFDNGNPDLEHEDDVFSDATDTLSPAESMSINCSASGVSSLEVASTRSSVRSSIVEKQAKEFMMSRFLHAAKAVALETPQYDPKQKFVVPEMPKQMKKIVAKERNRLLDQKSWSNLVLAHYQPSENIESEAGDEENDARSKRSGKAWTSFLPRIVPRLCAKKSLCMLNPLPGLRTKPPSPKSPANDISRLARKAHSGPLDKPAWDVNHKKRFHSGALSGELYHYESKMRESNQFSYSSASNKLGLSPFRTVRSAGVSPYRNATPQSPFNKGATFLGLPKDVQNPSNNYKGGCRSLASPSPFLYKEELMPTNGVVEKTVYIDPVYSCEDVRNRVYSQNVKPARSFRAEKSAESRRKEEVERMDMISKRETKKVPKTYVSQDADLSKAARVSKLNERMESVKLDQRVRKEGRAVETDDELKDKTDSSTAIVLSPLPPPLPKSPSESWLWKSVPSVHFRNPFSHANNSRVFHLKNVGEKAYPPGSKWETIVKSSHLHHSHSRYSEELIPHISH